VKALDEYINSEHKLRPTVDQLVASSQRLIKTYRIELEYQIEPGELISEMKYESVISLHKALKNALRKYHRTEK
jgi:uncharacterized protein YqgV (UPF0045/DUF77 family)